jgi:hypothetical protein
MRLRNARTPLSALFITCVLTACGGSASETPEPERPDSWQLKLRQSERQVLNPSESDESRESDAIPVRNRDERPAPAKSTWGTGRRTPTSVEAPSAPTTKTNSGEAPSKP